MIRLRLCLITAVVIALLGSSTPRAQGLTGLQANWSDLEVWARALDNGSGETEFGLGLQPSGSLIAFLARMSAREPRRPPRDIRVQIATSPLANPNLVRRATLTLLADANTEDRASFDLSASLVVDDSTPGGNLQNGIATMSAGDFVRIAQAKTLRGDIFGFDVVFTRAQIEAMKAFAARLNLIPAR
jgi:hypothetical protein